MKETFLLISGLLILKSLLISGCFITNCPPGGKRSGSDTKIRQCEQCGPSGMNGLCYGPHICCSSEGCLLGTSETLTCSQENLLHTSPCQNPGDQCSGNDDSNPLNGKCAAPGICCSSETCTVDDSCHNHGGKEEDSNNGQQQSGGSGKEQNPHHFATNPKDHSFGGGNPLDRWIPRRFSLGGASGGRRSAITTGQRKPIRVIPPDIQVMAPGAAENPFLDRIIYPETYGRNYNDEY